MSFLFKRENSIYLKLRKQVLRVISKKWNLRAINYNFQNKHITLKERDELIALLYSDGKSKKLYKMRGHHFSYIYFFLRGEWPSRKIDHVAFPFQYTVEFSNLVVSYNDSLTQDSIIEIVEGVDDVCHLKCPYFYDCEKKDYMSSFISIYDKFLNKVDFLRKEFSEEEIEKKLNHLKKFIDDNVNTDEVDQRVLSYFNLKVGDIVRLRDVKLGVNMNVTRKTVF